jgi:hypothetical protein
MDQQCRFTAFSSSCPGGMGDSIAYLKWKLSTVNESICEHILREEKRTIYLLGDNAYTNSNVLLTPFPKPKITSVAHDSYNFHLSQLRIHVEMAFGLLVNKWRLFKQPLQVRMSSSGQLIHTAFRLHNYCINMRLQENPDDEALADTDLVHAVNHVQTALPKNGSPYSSLYDSSDPVQGNIPIHHTVKHCSNGYSWALVGQQPLSAPIQHSAADAGIRIINYRCN